MARRQATILRCDGCGKVEEIGRDEQTATGWLQVRVESVSTPGKLDDASPFDLCSARCVGRWAKDRSEAVNGDGRAGYEKRPCPECGQLLAPQGFRQHWLTTHDPADLETARAMYREQEEVTEE